MVMSSPDLSYKMSDVIIVKRWFKKSMHDPENGARYSCFNFTVESLRKTVQFPVCVLFIRSDSYEGILVLPLSALVKTILRIERNEQRQQSSHQCVLK